MGNTKSVETSNYTYNLCEKLFSFCETQDFSDVCVIGSDDVRFYAHKNVLSAASEYFMAMFGGSLKETKENEVKIQEVSGEILKPILAFMYTGTIELQRETIEDTLKASNFFQIKPLTIACCKFLEDDLSVNNCLKIASFAGENKYTELCEKASKYASKHFEDISNGMDFLKLSVDVLSLIISSENLCAPSEEKVFLSLIEWIDHDKHLREKCAFNLISKVRYRLLSSNFIKQQVPKLCHQVECVQLIITWIEWHASSESPKLKPFTLSKSEGVDTLKPKRASELILISGSRKQTYNPDLNTWTCDDFTGYPSSFDKMCVLKNKLFFSDQRQPLKCFDLVTKETTELPGLYLGRNAFGLAVLKDELYAVGGRTSEDESSWTRCVDKYNFFSGEWQSVTSMNVALSNPQATVIGGVLYVVGDGSYIRLQCFDSESNKWTSKSSFNPKSEISLFGFAEVSDKLFIVGGKIKGTSTGSYYISDAVRFFNTLLDKWDYVNMDERLRNPACISWNNRLIVWGGYDREEKLLNFFQEYNPELKEWRHLSKPNDLFCCGSYALLKI